MTTTASPIGAPRNIGADVLYPCLACTNASTAPPSQRAVEYTTDPQAHVAESHPEARTAVEAQFAPRHAKIVRSAR